MSKLYGDLNAVPAGIYPVPTETSKGTAYMRVEVTPDRQLNDLGLFWDKKFTHSWVNAKPVNLFNTPEEVAAWLPKEIGDKYLKIISKINAPVTLDEALCVTHLVDETEIPFWMGVRNRAMAGEFDRPSEETEQANDFFKHYETIFKVSPFKDWPENADKLDNDAKLKLMGPLLDTFGPILLRALFRLGLQDKGVYQHLDITWEGEAGEWVLSLLNKKYTPPTRSLDEIKDEIFEEVKVQYPDIEDWHDIERHMSPGLIKKKWTQAAERYAASESAHHRARAEQLEAENKRLKMQEKKGWSAGFVCALCIYLSERGVNDTYSDTLWKSGGVTIQEAKEAGCPDHEIDLLEKYYGSAEAQKGGNNGR